MDLELVKQANEALRSGNIHAALTLLERFFNEQPTQTDQGRIDDAWRTLKGKYIQELEAAVDSVRSSYCAGTYDADIDDLRLDIENTADAYTQSDEDAQICLLFSENADAAYREHGEIPGWDHGMPWSYLASYAFKADMIEELGEAGIDINLIPPASDEIAIKCDSCGEIRIAVPGDDTCISCHEEAGNEQCYKCNVYWDPDELDEDDLCPKCAASGSSSK